MDYEELESSNKTEPDVNSESRSIVANILAKAVVEVTNDNPKYPIDPKESYRSTPEVGVSASSHVAFIIDSNNDFICNFGALITALKGVKVNYIHAIKCLKRRHRNCDYTSYYDHHHDILGAPLYSVNQDCDVDADDDPASTPQGATAKRPVPEALQSSLPCIVAEMSHVLLDSISVVKYKASQIHLLSTLRSVGTCCCLQPERIVSAIVPHLPHFSPAVRNFALETLTAILLDQFQGSQDHQSLQKSSVEVNTNAKEKKKDSKEEESSSGSSADYSRCTHCFLDDSGPLLAGLPPTLDSGFSSCDIEEIRRQKLLERWKSLRLLRKMIISQDESVSLSCAKHLMTLAICGNNEIKEELFFGVYLHVLHMKVRMMSVFDPKGNKNTEKTEGCSLVNSQESFSDYAIGSGSADISSAEERTSEGNVSSSVMLLCVSALPYVLQVEKVMSMFLQRGGLAKLTDLLEYQPMRAPVMSVFEALIMIDERRLRGRKAPADYSNYRDAGVIQTFIDTLAKKTCYVTASLQELQSARESSQGGNTDSKESDNSSSDKTPDNSQSAQANVTTSLGDLCDMSKNLPVLLDMWKTCAKLCMNSRTFRSFYKDSPCLFIVEVGGGRFSDIVIFTELAYLKRYCLFMIFFK